MYVYSVLVYITILDKTVAKKITPFGKIYPHALW